MLKSKSKVMVTIFMIIAVLVSVVGVTSAGTSEVRNLIADYSFEQNGTRNNHEGYMGMKITVGDEDMTVLELGRIYIEGNSESHKVAIFGTDGTELASVTINMAAGTADSKGFKYATLQTPFVLTAGTSYYLASLEKYDGDFVYEYSAASPSEDATIDAAVYWYDGGGWTETGGENALFGPPTLKYTIEVEGDTQAPTAEPTQEPTTTPGDFSALPFLMMAGLSAATVIIAKRKSN